MIDTLLVAMNDTLQKDQSKQMHAERKHSIGLIQEKMTDRYQVDERVSKKSESWEQVFAYADAYGKIRLGYFGGRFKEQTTRTQNSFAAAVGGILGIQTAVYKGFRLNAATYVSQDLPFLYDTDKRSNDFYTEYGDSYAYLAEAEMEYASTFFQAKIGRFGIDMPYANKDDLRMSQNTFEGGWLHLHYTKEWSSQFFFLQRWAGFDSSDANVSQSEFKKLVEGGSGMIGASILYKYNEDSEASLWYHHIDKMADILYGEINGAYDATAFIHIDYGLQAADIMQRDASHIDGEVYGAMLMGHYNDFFMGAAANFAQVDAGNSITDGFGGGPYFTSLDEATIAYASESAPGEDIDMYRFSAGYDKKEWYSSFEYAYGYMHCRDNFIKEHDLIYTFNLDEKWQAQAIGANFRMKNSDNRFNRVVIRIDYNF